MKIVSRKSAYIASLMSHYSILLVGVIQGIVLVPFFLKEIGTIQYAKWLVVSNIVTWLSTIDPGFSDVLKQKISTAVARKNKLEISKIFGVSLLWILWILVAMFCLSNIGDFLISRYYSDVEDLFVLCTMGITLSLISHVFSSYLLGHLQSIRHGGAYFLSNVIPLGALVYLVSHGYGILSFGYVVLLKGILMFLTLGGFFLFMVISNKYGVRICFQYAKSTTNEIKAVFLSRTSRVLIENSDALIIKSMLGEHWVPVFVLSTRVSRFARTFIELIPKLLIGPLSHMVSTASELYQRRIMTQLFRVILLCVTTVASIIILLNKAFIDLWVGSEFYFGDLSNFLLGINFFMISAVIAIRSLLFSYGNIIKASVVDFQIAIGGFILSVILLYLFGFPGFLFGGIVFSTLGIIRYYGRMIAHLVNVHEFIGMYIRDFSMLMCSLLIAFVIPFIVEDSSYLLLCIQGGICSLPLLWGVISLRSKLSLNTVL